MEIDEALAKMVLDETVNTNELNDAMLLVGKAIGHLSINAYLAKLQGVPAPDPDPQPTPIPSGEFRLFEDIRYKNTPNFAAMGIEPVKLWYEAAFFTDKARPGDGNFNLPANSKVRAAASAAPAVSCVDIERWWGGNGAAVPQAGLDAYKHVAEVYRAALSSGKKWGFYSTIPIRNYWAVIRGAGDLEDWKLNNDKLKGLGELVDYTFPSCYTFYEDRAANAKYVAAQINEAKRIAPGKPCYAFLWPEYHVSNKDRKGDPIEKSYFREILDVCREHADGAVIWNLSNKKSVDFDEVPDWWEAVEEFLADL